MADYGEEERELLRQAAAMRDLIDTKPWNVYKSVLESQIKTREQILLDEPASGGASPMERLLQLEQVKGARLGLKLALETVDLIIADSKAMVNREAGESEDEAA